MFGGGSYFFFLSAAFPFFFSFFPTKRAGGGRLTLLLAFPLAGNFFVVVLFTRAPYFPGFFDVVPLGLSPPTGSVEGLKRFHGLLGRFFPWRPAVTGWA